MMSSVSDILTSQKDEVSAPDTEVRNKFRNKQNGVRESTVKVWIANREVKRTQSVYNTIKKKFLSRAISELQDDSRTAPTLCPFLSTPLRYTLQQTLLQTHHCGSPRLSS